MTDPIKPTDPLTAAREALDEADRAVEAAAKAIEALPDDEPEAFPLADRASRMVRQWRTRISGVRADSMARFKQAADQTLADLAKRYSLGRGTVQNLVDPKRRKGGRS